MKNLYNNLGTNEKKDQKTYYVSIKGHDSENDFKVEHKDDGSYTITDVASGKSSHFKAGDFDLDYGAILRFNFDNKSRLVQFLEAKDNFNFNFYYKGNTLTSTVYDEQ